ncbi:RNI-like protein [Linderina pennispora]|uniref:RNI-like protein n=1 Tax=Linderina pennispora TaxID=61395 RepID=A0A1Y1WE06_9FUNG|nr:RNI-like protein [Linderina pennispora]ORX71635.1 RNI-like protein [Linderina pennispora]
MDTLQASPGGSTEAISPALSPPAAVSFTGSASGVCLGDPRQPASARVPPEVLEEIFGLLQPHQKALHSCMLTCRLWKELVTPLLWRRPQFARLSQVIKFASTLSATAQGRATSHYTRLVHSLSFSRLAEADRNHPKLAGSIGTIIHHLVAVVAPAAGPCGTGDGQFCSGPLTALKRSKSLSRNDEESARPYSAIEMSTEPSATSVYHSAAAEIPVASDTADSNDDSEYRVAYTPAGTDPLDLQDPQWQLPKAASGFGPLSKSSLLLDVSLPAADDTHLSYSGASTSYHKRSMRNSMRGPRHSDGLSTDHYTSSLRHLDLCFCKGVRNYSLQRLAPRLSSLTSLNLAGGLRSDITMAKLSQHLTGLRRISLAWTAHLTDFGVGELAQHCPRLEVIDLTHCTQIEDTSLTAIAYNLKALKALSVAYCTGITDIGVREVATKCTKISVLNVMKCVRVSDVMRKTLSNQSIICECTVAEPFSIDTQLSR